MPHAERHFEIASTVILAIAALATAWAGYQASLWDGIQSSDYGKASAIGLLVVAILLVFSVFFLTATRGKGTAR